MNDTSITNRRLPSYISQLLWVYIPILILLSPFTLHRSSQPVWLCYSWHYIFLLGLLSFAGLGFAAILLLIVRRAPPHRRLAFAYLMLSGLVMSIVIIELIFGVVEGDAFSGFRTWGQQRSPFVGFENIPGYAQSNSHGSVTFDEHGFRTHSTKRVATEKEQLIVVMGGSSAFGFGLDDEDTWPMELERHLRRQFGDHITVLNAANRGHNSMQQLIRLYQRVLPLKPSVVIYYGAWNDLNSGGQPMHMPWLSPTLAQSSSARHFLRLRNHGSGLYWENSFILDRFCQLARKFSPTITASRDASPHPSSLSDSDSLAAASTLFVRNIDTMNILCHRDSVLFIPVRYVADVDNLKPDQREGLHVFADALQSYCRRKNVNYIDVEAAFEEVANRSAMFQEDHYHPTIQGAKLLGSRVAESVGDSLFPSPKTLVSIR